MTDAPLLRAAYAAIDAANARDPRRVSVVRNGRQSEQAYELVYGQRMSAVLASFAAERNLPAPSTALQLAVRAQHLERWTLPRDSYPMDRPGYHRWRTELKSYHARRAAEILRGLGYTPELTDRVGFLLEKKRLGRDPETQTLEDVACLVFLRYYAADFAANHPDEQVVRILRKTWAKMSPDGRDAALASDLPAHVGTLVARALAEVQDGSA